MLHIDVTTIDDTGAVLHHTEVATTVGRTTAMTMAAEYAAQAVIDLHAQDTTLSYSHLVALDFEPIAAIGSVHRANGQAHLTANLANAQKLASETGTP